MENLQNQLQSNKNNDEIKGILNGKRIKNIFNNILKYFFVTSSVMLCFIFWRNITDNPYIFVNPIVNCIIISIIVPIAIWFVFGGTLNKLPQLKYKKSKFGKWLIFFAYVFLTIIIICIYFIFNKIILINSDKLENGISVGFIKNYRFLLYGSLIIMILAIYGFYYLSPQFITVIIYVTSNIICIIYLFELIKHIHVTDRLIQELINILREALFIFMS